MRSLIEKLVKQLPGIADPTKRELLRHAMDKYDAQPSRKDFLLCIRSFREALPDVMLDDAQLAEALAAADEAERRDVEAKARAFNDRRAEEVKAKESMKAEIMAELGPEIAAAIVDGLKSLREKRDV